MPQYEINLDFHTSHHQFYIHDKFSTMKTDSDTFWTETALEMRLAVEEGVIGVETGSYGHIKGEVRLLKSENKNIDMLKFDHIVEAALMLQSGILQISPCIQNEIIYESKLNPGVYKVRIYCSNLKNINLDEFEDEGNDRYLIEIWPDIDSTRKVLKKFGSEH